MRSKARASLGLALGCLLGLHAAAGAVEITTLSLPSGMEMVPYSAQLEATNGVAPYTWSAFRQTVAWGANGNGQSTIPCGLGNVVSVSGGGYHSLALKTNGTVTAWGDNVQGQCSIPSGLRSVVGVAGGGHHSLAVRSDGTVVAWGANWDGQCTIPSGLSNVVRVAGGRDHSLALRSDGTLTAWGDDMYGQSTIPSGLTSVVGVAGGVCHTLALKADGTVAAWGSDYQGQRTIPSGLSNVVGVAAGGYHSLALRADGTVAAWGCDGDGQSTIPSGLSNVVGVAGGEFHSLALKTDGTVVAWGRNDNGQCTIPNGLRSMVGVTAGGYHSLALRESSAQLPDGLTLLTNGTLTGTPILTGTNVVTFIAQDNLGESTNRPLEIVIASNPNTRPAISSNAPASDAFSMPEGAGQTFTVWASDPEGSNLTYRWTWDGAEVGSNLFSYTHVTDWGDMGTHELRCYVSDDLWSNIVHAQWDVTVTNVPIDVASPSLPSGIEMVAYSAQLEATNGVAPYTWSVMKRTVTWGHDASGQCSIPSELGDVVGVAGGGHHSLALKADGTVTAWGYNWYGQCTIPSGLSNVVGVVGGGSHSMALKANGTVVAWGDNCASQCTIPSGLTNVVGVAGGGNHNLALKLDGTLAAWGYNGAGQCTIPNGLSNVVGIAAGGNHSLALMADGTVVGWGNDSHGQTTIPSDLSNVVGVAAGCDHSLALRSDGTVAAWGVNWAGQSTIPSGLSNVVGIAAGNEHSLALKTDGTVVAWGDNQASQCTIPSGLNDLVVIAAGGFHNLALRAKSTQLPDGLTLLTSGTLTGMPLLAGTNVVSFIVQDSLDETTNKPLALVIAPNPNTRPVIVFTDPPQGSFSMDEATGATFQVAAYDPEFAPLTYSWTWDGAEVGSNLSSYEHVTEWGDAGLHELRCCVADDLWSNIVYAQWNVTVLDDNDADGMPNGKELDLGRDPNDPSDSGAPSTLAGTVTCAGVSVSWAYVDLRGAGGATYHHTRTDPAGAYTFSSVQPGHYYVKVGALYLADEWYENATHRTNAISYAVPSNSVIMGFDFELEVGRNPALVEVTSDPAGAAIYLDFQPTAQVTPAVLNIGERGELDWTGADIASHTITVKKAGRPQPSPRNVPAREAETVAMHFDLSSDEAGALSVSTTPEGAEVFVDYADAAAGVSPIVMGNLAPGSHVILLRDPAWLQPRPVAGWVTDGLTNAITIPLTAFGSSNRIGTEVRSVPQGATVYVDYLSTTNVTDIVVDWLDAASHSGLGWHSLRHTVMLRKAGYDLAVPRYVLEATNPPPPVIEVPFDLRPIILATTPWDADPVFLSEGDAQAFSVTALDPEGSNLTYHWTWAGTAVGADSNAYTLSTTYADVGMRDLRCYVSDGAWTNVYAEWQVTVADLPLEIATVSMPVGMEMVPYSCQLETSNGTPPFVWTRIEGYPEQAQPNSFSPTGTAQGWHADDNCWAIAIPFGFPFFGKTNSTLYISSNGTITFDDYFSQYWVDVDTFKQREMISVLWADLSTYVPDDIRVEIGADTVTVYWDARYLSGGSEVNCSATLTSDGIVTLRYGSGNAKGGMIGVSAGNGQDYVLSTRNQSGSMSNASDIIFVFAPGGPLPEGLSCSADGLVAGLPTLAGTNLVTFMVRDSLGANTKRNFEIVIAPNPNLRPVISFAAPALGPLSMGEATSATFQVAAFDPEFAALGYFWTWDGAEVGANLSSYMHVTDWGDAGLHALRCYVSDDLWSNIVYGQWDVTVLADNDADGMPNWQELDLGRDPNDPSDAGNLSTLEGKVSGGGVGLWGAYVELRGSGGATYHRTSTDAAGFYAFNAVLPGHYYAKAGANRFADEWYENATHRTNAIPYAIPADSTIVGFDFDLESGQNAALVEVTSEPSGAAVYLDFQATAQVTPAILNVGEVGELDWTGMRIASHTITVKKAGRPQPSPRQVSAREAETVAVHFDLTSDEVGALSVSTTPEGTDVFVDYADAAAGVSPVIVENLAPGSHVILLREPASLRPRPIIGWVTDQMTNTVAVPLAGLDSSNRVSTEVRSVPPGATVYVDYLPTTNVTDVVVDWLDAASHSGVGWHSASHTIMLRKSGYLPAAPRYVPDQTNETHLIVVHLAPDVENEIDHDEDGMADQWEDAYGISTNSATGDDGPDGDPDGDGATNDEERRAGTNPMDETSGLWIANMQPQQAGQPFTIVFDSVPGRCYLVLCTEDIPAGWAHASGVITANAYQTVWTTTVPQDTRCWFCHVIVLHP